MPAPKDQPNLRLIQTVVPQGERGAVIPASSVLDPDSLVILGAAVWTAEPVTVHTLPPAHAPLAAASPEHLNELATARQHAEELAHKNMKAESDIAELKKALKAGGGGSGHAGADAARADAAEKELAELKAAVAKVKSLKDAHDAVK